jgi:hypothetical protein
MRNPRLCECGKPVTTVNGRFCDGCRRERNSHGGRPRGSGNSDADRHGRYQALSNHHLVRVQAKCPKCQVIHYVKLRKDPGRKIYEFCPRHAGLRQIPEYIPTAEISRDILRIRA